MALRFEVVTEIRSARREYVIPDFRDDPRFNNSWWQHGSAKSPVSYGRFLDADEEVARVKVLLGTGEYSGYETWTCPRGGATEIDLIEVRIDLRTSGHRYGQRAVEEVVRHFGEPVVAMSLDDNSDGFWRSLGWTAHVHPDADEYRSYRTLFTSI